MHTFYLPDGFFFQTVNVVFFQTSLELSEKAKKDLMEFEEQERQKRQNRYGGRGGGRGGRGGRGRGGFPGFGSSDFRGGKRGRMHEIMPPLMGNMNIQVKRLQQLDVVHIYV